jgi:glycerol-3-phosphate cytidylyltransferase
VSIVYTGGTFDLFHAGHVQFLRRCAGIAGDGGRVIVALNNDEFISRYKGKPPAISYVDRETVLAACRYVYAVIPNWGDEDSRPAIDLVKPDVIAIGDDWRGRDYFAQMGFDQDWLDERWISLVYVPYSYASEGLPSSGIRRKLR